MAPTVTFTILCMEYSIIFIDLIGRTRQTIRRAGIFTDTYR
jgi:hypothetical protein